MLLEWAQTDSNSGEHPGMLLDIGEYVMVVTGCSPSFLELLGITSQRVSEVVLPGTSLFLARCEVRDVKMSLLRDIMEKITLLQQRLSEAEILVKGAAEALGESSIEVRLFM